MLRLSHWKNPWLWRIMICYSTREYIPENKKHEVNPKIFVAQVSSVKPASKSPWNQNTNHQTIAKPNQLPKNSPMKVRYSVVHPKCIVEMKKSLIYCQENKVACFIPSFVLKFPFFSTIRLFCVVIFYNIHLSNQMSNNWKDNTVFNINYFSYGHKIYKHMIWQILNIKITYPS